MNLLGKNTRYLLIILPVILLLCSGIFYFLLKWRTHHLQEKQLLLKQENVLNKYRSGTLDTTLDVVGEFAIRPGKSIPEDQLGEPRDTAIYYPGRKKMVAFEMLTREFQRNGKTYQLTTFVSSVEITHLIIAIFIIQGLIYVVLLIAIIQANKRLSRTLWRPFHKTVHRLSQYDINATQPLQLDGDGGITEFRQLNDVAAAMVAKNRQAYLSQKQFVENASHEIQTPLAIIRSKVELLMDQPELDENSADLIGEIAIANDRLSRLNKTLLLLSKIENNQFIEKKDIRIKDLVQQLVASFQKHATEDLPDIKSDLSGDPVLFANPVMMEILFGNLVKNAIIHNIPAGSVNIVLKNESFCIDNTGPKIDVDPGLLFDRFKKGDYHRSQSSGLGLALVKQVCELYHFSISYSYKEPMHRLELLFGRAS